MPELEICDKNGERIKEGDIIMSHAGWCNGDGKLRKNFPDTIRVICRIVWDKHRACYYSKLICTHPDDMKFSEWGWYRRCSWSVVKVSWDNEKMAAREDMRAMHFDIVRDQALIDFASNGKFSPFRGTPIDG